MVAVRCARLSCGPVELPECPDAMVGNAHIDGRRRPEKLPPSLDADGLEAAGALAESV
jgi:hypothetical protein